MCLLLDKLDSNIKLFSLLMEKAKENILQASKLYVSMIDKYGEEAKKRFQLVNQSIPKTAWTSIERVGRGAMYEKILFTRFLHDKRVIMLPLSEQQKISDSGVEYLTANGDTLMVKLESMTEDQVKQVVSSGTIRSVGDQRIYIESQKRKQEIKPYNGNDYYRTEKGKLHILAPVTLSKRQLRNILNDL